MAAFNDRVGVTIEESISNAFTLGSGVSTRNVGLLMETERGVPNKPVLFNSLREFTRMFGTKQSSMYSAYVVESLFNNLNGYPANIYGVRIIDPTSEAATVVLKNQFSNIQEFEHITLQVATATQPQIDQLKPKNVDIGDVFTVTINGGTADTHTAVSTDPDAVVTALVTAIGTTSGVTATASPDGHYLILTADDDDTPFTAVAAATNNNTVNEPIATVSAAYQGALDPGTWGNDLRIRVYPKDDPQGAKGAYLFVVYYKDKQVEQFTGATWAELFADINARSEFVMVDTTDLTKDLTHGVFAGSLSGGTYEAPTEEMFEPAHDDVTFEPQGLAIFEGVDAQILACPEVFSTNFTAACEAFCRDNRRFFVFAAPYNATESVVEQYNNVLTTGDASFCAGYLNWLEVPAVGGGVAWIPPTGFVLAAGYVRKSGAENGVAWSIPGGIGTVGRGFSRITEDAMSEDKIGRYAKKWSMNVIKYVPNVGPCIWTSRTYSANPLFQSIHIRLETNWLMETLLIRNARFVQRLNTPSLQREMLTDTRMFMRNIYDQGGVENSVPFDTAVVIEVITSKEDRKNVEETISWIPPEQVEHIHLRLSRNDGVLLITA
jgi:hypothetical protein